MSSRDEKINNDDIVNEDDERDKEIENLKSCFNSLSDIFQEEIGTLSFSNICFK